MSVIITGITSDIKCIDCPMRDLDDNCLAQKYESETWEEMKADCPLKSIDGLIENIKTTDSDYRYNGHNLSIDGVIEIIKEYCEVSE